LNSKTALDIAAYVLQTGDEETIVRFLEEEILEGKTSEEETLEFVDTIQEYLDDARMFSEEVTTEDEKAEAAARTVLQELLSNSAGNQDSTSILKINKFLESGLKGGEISETLYGHLKEALIETTLEEAQY